MTRFCGGVLLVLFLSGLAQAAAPALPVVGVDGRVTRVVDGDSLWVSPRSGGRAIEVRLADIDAPEICQDGGIESRRQLAARVLKRKVRLRVPAGRAGRDKYGRTLATVWLGGLQVNRSMVEQGQAWSRRGQGNRGPYLAEERQARALNRGVFRAGTSAMPPWDFRKRHGPCR